MRSSKSRSRNKSNRQRTLGNVVNRVFDSSGPEGKVRGTPQQIIDKYLTLARDAQLSGDRVAEQAFLQHAEHYTRMLGEAQREMAERQQFHGNREGDDNREAQPNGNGNGQHRDGGSGRDQNREEFGRDNSRRDNGGRENGQRDNGGRDPHREQPRENGGRDPHREQPRTEPVAPPAIPPVAELRVEDRQQPEPAPLPEANPEPQPEGLPDAVTIREDEEAAGPVETPEAAARPARARTPRAPRGDKPATPRAPRRRRTPEGEAAPEGSPAASEE